MSNSGPTNFLSTAQTNNNRQQSTRSGAQSITGQITNPPENARNAERTVRIRGEVVRSNERGDIRIKTEKGTVDVRAARSEGGTQPRPEAGQQVDIEIQPARNRSTDTADAVREVRITIRRDSATPPPPEYKLPDTQNLADTTAQNTQSAQQTASGYPSTAIPDADIRFEALPDDAPHPNITVPTPEIIESALPDGALPPSAALPARHSEVPLQQADPLIITAAQHREPAALPPIQAQAFPDKSLSTANLPPSVLARLQPQIQSNVSNILESQTTFVQKSEASQASAQQILNVQLNTNTATTAVPLGAPAATHTNAISTALHNDTAIPSSPPRADFQAGITDILKPDVIFFSKGEAIKPANLLLQSAKEERISAKALKSEIFQQNTPIGNISATLEGFSENKLPILKFNPTFGEKSASFLAHIPLNDISVGSTLFIKTPPPSAIQGSASAAAQHSYTIPPSTSFFQTPGAWPMMQDILQTSAQSAAQSAQIIQSSLANMSPNPATPNQIGPAILFFMAALKNGDIQSWLGEKTIETLRNAGRSNLLSRISQEGSALSRMSNEPVSQDWRAVSLPLYWENDIQKIALHYKHDDDSNNETETSKRTRFIFDLNVIHMGPVQLDGLHREKKLDMIIRTENPFSQSMRMTMKQLYTGALEHAGLNGELSFQNHPDQWATITPDQNHIYDTG